MSFCLSSKGLKNINIDQIEKNFRFIVNNEVYETNLIIAEFMSSKLNEMLSKDESIREFRINVDGSDEIFGKVLRLGYGDSLEINESNRQVLFDIGVEMGNEELCDYCVQSIGSINRENVCELLLLKGKYFHDNEEECDFLSTHFYEIGGKELEKLDPRTILKVIKNERLRLKDEDSLLDFLIDFCKKHENNECEELFHYVQFEHVSRHSLFNFFEYLKANVEIFNPDLCESLKKRLCFHTFHINDSVRYLNSSFGTFFNRPNTIFSYNSNFDFHDNPFDGIIAYLSKECQGNVVDKGIIGCQSSSVLNGYAPRNIVDFRNDTLHFQSKNEQDSWIYYDFKDNLIKPTHYTLKTSARNCSFLKSWVIELSSTGNDNDWIVIDERNNDDLNGYGRYRTYEVRTKPDNYYRFIRLRQTGRNAASHGTYFLVIACWEIFGQFIHR